MSPPSGLQLHEIETPAQVFSCQFSKIFKNIYFAKHLWMADSDILSLKNGRDVESEKTFLLIVWKKLRKNVQFRHVS